MNLSKHERALLADALLDHAHVVTSWDDKVAAEVRRSAILRLKLKLDEPAQPPEAVQDESSVARREGLRSALASLRDAVDNAAIADHLDRDLLNMVDLILDRTKD